jgi:hypothetical protein
MKKVLCALAFLVSSMVNARQLIEKETNIGGQINRLSNADVTFQLPRFIFSYTNTRVIVKFNNPNNDKLTSNNRTLNLIVNGGEQKVVFDDKGVGSFYYTFKGSNDLQVLYEDVNYSVQPKVISIWYVLAPLLAILLFFIYRITLTLKKNKAPKMVVNHNTDSLVEDVHNFTSTLKVVRVKEPVEEF